MTITTNSAADNGVNVEALLGAKAAMIGAPPAAQFTWQAASTWVRGTHSRTTIDKFFGVGAEQSHKQTYVLDTDHPQIFASEDNGITPPEMVLVGLAGCLTAGIASVATHRDIKLNSVTSTLEADMNLFGILGIDADVRNGFSGIRVHYTIDADATRDEIKAVVAQSQKRSAVFDIIANPTNITVDVI